MLLAWHWLKNIREAGKYGIVNLIKVVQVALPVSKINRRVKSTNFTKTSKRSLLQDRRIIRYSKGYEYVFIHASC